jgi:divalent metal cation (Fe/Co/Zn/Cd) transporter
VHPFEALYFHIRVLGDCDTAVTHKKLIIHCLARRAAEKRKEVITSTVIAGLMVLLGLLLLITSIKDLALHNTAVSVGASLVVSLFGAAASFALYKWKMYYGDQLQSIVVLTDAKCSRCVGCISVSVVLALVLQQVRPPNNLNALLF